MSPLEPEHDPVQKGLAELGRQIDDAHDGPAGGAAPDATAAPDNTVEHGLQQLGRQIDEARPRRRAHEAAGR